MRHERVRVPLVSLSVILVERTVAPKAYGLPVPHELLSRLSGILASLLWLYLVFRSCDVALEAASVANAGNSGSAFGGPAKALLFSTEIVIGAFLPALMLSFRRGRRHSIIRLCAALMVVFGGVLNRLDVAFLGMMFPGAYVPSLIEVIITTATVAGILLFYTVGTKVLPIYEASLPVPTGGDRPWEIRARFPAPAPGPTGDQRPTGASG